MNKSGIEWCDHTWNPITGCRHDCSYCYAVKMSLRFCGNMKRNMFQTDQYRMEGDLFVLDEPFMNEDGKPVIYPFGFEPTLHRYRLNTMDSLKMGNNIFVCGMADLFGEWVPESWIREIFEVIEEKPQHNWLLLTKNPSRYRKIDFLPEGKPNIWYGTTVTNREDLDRLNDFPYYSKSFVSIEPVLENLELVKHPDSVSMVDWIIVGAETGRRKNLVVPEFEWVKDIVLAADTHGIPIFMKDSLIDIVGEKNMRRDFPEELKKKTISKKLRNKLYDVCCECGTVNKKSDMYTLLARRERGVQPKQYGFMCDKCFEEFCKEKGLEVPKNRKVED